ncbi:MULTISPECIES: polyprenyl synthetase family protein [Chryseobacterium]|uniref:Polyprenyl synthetase family protein n=1 Tax=Chryseobacterium gambrini TaxID=373672 RepID=A0ABN7CBG6_9FLAO|nr:MULTISPECIES: polyprenyl synthetase family protein [unclassified Chryseobacterium]MCQ4139178.1 polyprenyl synthetase family protein [Chryseobacterium sp. EO14]BEV03715.1 polyprenyl synthetase family protein [Chryseobacterium gambrini]MCY1662452.1 polyprenyl synthetase family protein [Chryseobacterium sp. SL1]PTT77906.1 polyprenyl synthetase [Chryseobacterium sp. HMWF001]PVV56411.1 polyprenyl synthetase family protein [Chryseobacterium sp. HMWF035]
MANTVEEIKRPINEEMKLFEQKFYESMQSKVPLLDKVTRFIVTTKGKQMRPMFVFLCAKLVGDVNEKTYRGASMIELIHTATLVHDDVVDESFKRRNFFSINALWKNKIAVLVGDYLLSKSVLLSTDHKDYDLLGVISRTIREMSEGELLQLEKARKLDITEEVYYEIIRQKTATLIAACCEIGVLSNNADEVLAKKMMDFGTYTGMAFQIKDDLFDYLTSNVIGKPVGIDIKEQKMTLPLIHTLKIANEKDRKYYFNTIKRYNNDQKRVKELINFVKSSGGLEYAITIMKDFQQKAIDILNEFPDSEAKKSLRIMLDYVIERKF